VNCC